MRIPRLSFALALGLCLAPAATAAADDATPAASPPLPPGVVALVDGTPLTRGDLAEMLLREVGPLHVERLVSSFLIRREAARQGFAATDAELDAWADKQLEQAATAQFGGNRTQLLLLLRRRYGVGVEAFRATLRAQAETEVLAEKLVRARRAVADADLVREFERRYGAGGVKRRARHVFLTTNIWQSPLYPPDEYQRELPQIEAEAQKEAEALRERIAKGAEFAAIARERSDDPSATKGGDLERYWQNRFGPEFDRAAATLPVGEVSRAIRGTRGFHLLQVYEVREAWEVKARHVLFSTRILGKADEATRRAREETARRRAEEALAAIRAGAAFAAVARERSEDERTRERGGEFEGLLGDGALPLEQELSRAEPGLLPAPVQSEAGWHVLELVSRRRSPGLDRRHVRHVLLATDYNKVKERKLRSTLRERVRAEAERVLAEVRGGAEFAALARARSDDKPTAEKGGVVEDASRAPYGAAFARAVAEMGPGDPPRLVEGESGFHVIEVLAVDRTELAAVRDALRKEELERPVAPHEVERLREELRAAAKVVAGG